VKICPSCNQKHPIDSTYCDFCGHLFRTKFGATPPVQSIPPPIQPAPPPPTPPWVTAKQRQHPSVLADPKYLLDTGYGIGCPQCGATNISYLGKSGTGLGYFGSIGFVIAASVLDAWVSNYTPGIYQCGYCNQNFRL
jgi:hypothetical protein